MTLTLILTRTSMETTIGLMEKLKKNDGDARSVINLSGTQLN